MKHSGIMILGLTGGLALTASLNAADTKFSADPYALVVARNIFGLNPPAPVNTTPADTTPPPKITPNGVMTILGQLQVLFKVAGTAKPGVPAVDQSYILSEGQRQDDIEVVKIDEKAGLITFNNHGTVQPLILETAKGSSTPVQPTAPTGGLPGGRGGNNGAGGFGNSTGGAGGNGGGGGGAGGGANNDGSNLHNIPTRNNTFNAASQIPEGMTSDVQTVAIEVNRELTQQQVNNGEMPPLPITDLTPSDATGANGNPLAAEPPAPAQH